MRCFMITQDELLRRFGDTDKEIASAVGDGVSDWNIRDWRHRGIPGDRFQLLLDAAKRRNVHLSAEELIAAKRPKKSEAA